MPQVFAFTTTLINNLRLDETRVSYANDLNINYWLIMVTHNEVNSYNIFFYIKLC